MRGNLFLRRKNSNGDYVILNREFGTKEDLFGEMDNLYQAHVEEFLSNELFFIVKFKPKNEILRSSGERAGD